MLYIIISVLVVISDIITKRMAINGLLATDTMPIIKDVLHLTYVENRGMAFGMFDGGRMFFIMVTAAVLLVIAFILIKKSKTEKNVWQMMGFALVVGGAVGNLIDRVMRGFVVDFIDFRIINFPVFNVADIAVCVGSVLLVIYYLFKESKTGKKQSEGTNGRE